VINPQAAAAAAAASIQVLHLINTNCRQQTAAEYIYIYISMFLSPCDDLDRGSRIDPMSAPAAVAPY
jgi:hypothetical protein